MCQSETMHQIIDFFSVNNKKEKTNDDITDNEDSNNNNKCVSVSVCENCKKKNGKKFYKRGILTLGSIYHGGKNTI